MPFFFDSSLLAHNPNEAYYKFMNFEEMKGMKGTPFVRQLFYKH